MPSRPTIFPPVVVSDTARDAWIAAVGDDEIAFSLCQCNARDQQVRFLVKHLDGISDEAISGLNIPTGMPLVYHLDDTLTPLVAGGEYLDPEAAAAAAAAVANQGR